MHKIKLIIEREYMSRVRKKSFLITTFLLPVMFFLLYFGVIVLTKKSFEDSQATIHVIDDQGDVASSLNSNKNITYIVEKDKSLHAVLPEMLEKKKNEYALLIPKDFYASKNAELLSVEKPNINIQSDVRKNLSDIIAINEFKKLGIDKDKIDQMDNKVTLNSKEVAEDGADVKDSNTEIAMIVAMALSVLIYISLMLYGSQVMRGVIEEKSSRIIEVIISSVKPFQLMLGKIIGVGLVGLTQFALWLLFSGLLLSLLSNIFSPADVAGINNGTAIAQPDNLTSNIFAAIKAFDVIKIIVSFFVFFLGGYLMYSAFFAAVGAVIDQETEANQFTLPITMPLLLTYMLTFGVLVNDPNGAIATWLSFIPLTSPIAMMVRIAFGVPTWEIVVSALILVASFIGSTWLAGKIYRVGIFMYGKKASYKEIWKWLRYKN